MYELNCVFCGGTIIPTFLQKILSCLGFTFMHDNLLTCQTNWRHFPSLMPRMIGEKD